MTARAVEHVAVARQGDGGGEQLPPSQAAELTVRLEESCDAPRDTDGTLARERRRGRVAGRVDVHVAPRARGRRLAEVERADRAVVHPDDHEAAASDVARHRMD